MVGSVEVVGIRSNYMFAAVAAVAAAAAVAVVAVVVVVSAFYYFDLFVLDMDVERLIRRCLMEHEL